MRNRGINLGMMLILFGILCLLINTGLLNWSVFASFEYLWPVILIISGLNIVFNNKILNIALWVGFFISIIVFSTVYKPINKVTVKQVEYYAADKNSETKYGDLKLESGASNLNLSGDNKDLINISSDNKNFICKSTYSNNNENVAISVKHQPEGFSGQNELNVKLNKNILWDLRFDLGASKSTIDLSKNTVKKLLVNAGAARLDLILGKPQETSDVNFQFGASSVNINVPKNIGVKVRVRSALSDNNLNTLGWSIVGDTYISPNYDASASKYNIDLQMGAGNFNLSQY